MWAGFRVWTHLNGQQKKMVDEKNDNQRAPNKNKSNTFQ